LESRRLGVLGGSFNPIHSGHMHLAGRAQKLFSLDTVCFAIASTPPHKPVEDLIPLMHRYAMVCLATAGHPSFIPSLIELEPPSSPYSIHTLEKLSRFCSCKGEGLYFIAGGDSLAEVATWKESEKLLTSYSFIFAVRPGIPPVDPASVLPAGAAAKVTNLVGLEARQLMKGVRKGQESGGSHIFLVDLNALDVSSSQVRELARRNKPVCHLVPPSVNEYIQKTRLYGER
jgi:nicotinate-nucleotide adenylyltransferase